MRKEKVKRRVCYFGGLLALCLILYSCLKDESDWDSQETSNGVIKGENKELNVDVARSWYEANQAPIVSTRSVDTNFELLSKLHWKKGFENRKGKFEVVEVPLLNKGGAILMDSETAEKYKETERGKIRNISRMIIIKNLETGEIINFVMHIIGTYDYLMNTKHFEKNSYLYRDPHLSGSVYFYTPEGGLVNGWKYEDGKIVATISQGTEEGMRMQNKATTRVKIQDCRLENVLVEYNDCQPFLYEDPEYGPGFGIKCSKKTRWETVQICREVEYDDNGNITWYPEDEGGSPRPGGGGGGYTPQPVAPKAKTIFRNSKMTEENWKVVENMIDKMSRTTIGDKLYKAVKNELKGKTVVFEFIEGNNSRFNPILSGIELGITANSGSLFHEMFHLLQSYIEQETWNGSALNRDIEAHLAQQIYINSLPEIEQIWWKEKTRYDPRWNSTRDLTKYIDSNGYIRTSYAENMLQKILKDRIIKDFRLVGYNETNYPWLDNRTGSDNFKTLRYLLNTIFAN